MKIQRLRNLTTNKLHTEMGDIYKDIETLTGMEGIMTHQLPRANDSLRPFLREQIKDERFWDGKWDETHTGEIEVTPMNEEERKGFWKLYQSMPSPF